MSVEKSPFKNYNWLKNAQIYNKKDEIVPSEWITQNSDVLLLLFTSNGIDKEGIIEKFYGIYENVKYVNMPIEVVYVPMDDSEEGMKECYEVQANWFYLKFHDPLVHELKFVYGITCIPHIVALKVDGTLISSHAILDLEQYGKNAVITWLSTSASSKIQRKLSKDNAMYGDKWKYLNLGAGGKPEYSKRFTAMPDISKNVTNRTNV